jgi:hypothetical protein
MLYGTHRGLLRLIRRLLNPILKLFFNPGTVIHALHKQTEINALYEGQFYFLREKIQQRDEIDALYYELVHNLVLELTRIGIENRNLKMRLESLSSRMDFDERRARALEGVVQYRPGTGPAREASQPPGGSSMQPAHVQPTAEQTAEPGQGATSDERGAESGTARRRRRRRRGRRGGRGRAPELTAAGTSVEPVPPDESATPPHGDPTAHAALESGDSEPDFEPDSDSGRDEGPDPSAQ